MTSSVCLIHTDLMSLHLLHEDGQVAHWDSPTIPESAEDSLALVQARVNEASAWVREELGSRSLDLVCLDVSETRCIWLRAPSAEPPVLAASFRAASEEWGDLVPTGTLEAIRPLGGATNGHAKDAGSLLNRLNQPLGAEKKGSSAIAGPVVHAPDTIARLWLDALDRRGVHPDRVLTLWHAMAQAWDAPAEPGAELGSDTQMTGVVLLDEQEMRAVWSWSRAGELIVGGHTSLPAPPSEIGDQPAPEHDALVSRLALDWLSWASQEGAMPDRIVVVGPRDRSGELREGLGARWPQVETIAQETDQPIGATLEGAGRAEAPTPDSPATCLLALTHRSSRRTRRRYRWSAAALVLLAGALGISGYRLRDAGAELESLAASERAQANAAADALGIPEITGRATKTRALQSHLATLRSGPSLELPPPPPPVFDELQLVLEALAAFADDGNLRMMTIDKGRNSQIQFQIEDLGRLTDLRITLEDLESQLQWKQSPRAQGRGMLQMEGAW